MGTPYRPWEPLPTFELVPVGLHTDGSTMQHLERYDGRMLLGIASIDGQSRVMWSWQDEDDPDAPQTVVRYLVARVSDAQVAELEMDHDRNREALLNPLDGWVYLVDVDMRREGSRAVLAAWRCRPREVPDEYLPREDAEATGAARG